MPIEPLDSRPPTVGSDAVFWFVYSCLHKPSAFKQNVCIAQRYKEPEEMDWRADYSQIIPPFVAPSSPTRLWNVFDQLMTEDRMDIFVLACSLPG